MANQGYQKPLPRINRLSRPFWEGAKLHEFRLQSCKACGHKWFPPSPRCSECLSADYEWVKASGRGRLWSWINMWQRYYLSFAEDIPYNVAYVELDEGPKLMTNLVDFDPETLHCDMPVEVVFDDVTDEVSLPKFRPVSG